MLLDFLKLLSAISAALFLIVFLESLLSAYAKNYDRFLILFFFIVLTSACLSGWFKPVVDTGTLLFSSTGVSA
jgi:hypothetical protein